MDNIRILERSGRGWWTIEEIASLLRLAMPQTAVFCARATARGDLTRLKRGVYLLPSWIQKADETDLFALSSLLQTPSYISFLTALSRAGITTQMQRAACEAVSCVRSARYEVEGFAFSFVRLPQRLFFGFQREGVFFIAEQEKAFLDAAYLASLGRYAIDTSALDFARLDRKKIIAYAKRYPERAMRFVRKIMEGS